MSGRDRQRGDRGAGGGARGARARLGRRAARRRRAGDALDPMRHSAAHVMAEAVLDLFPGTKLGHRAGDRGRLLLRLRAAAAADARRPRGDRGADGARASPPTTRSSGASCRRRRAAPSSPSATSRSRSRSSTTSRRRRSADGTPMPPTTRLRARAVHRPVPRAARREHGQDRAVQAARGLRRVLARRPEAPDAPAHLRHGLGDAGGARHVPLAARGGEEARPPPARRPARPVLLPRRVAGRRLLAPQGLALYQTLRDAMRELQARRGYQEIYTPPLVHQKLWEQSGHWDHYRDNMFLVEAEEQTFSLKPMNCPESTFIYRSQGALVPRLAAAPLRVRRAPPQRAVAALSRPDAGAPLRHGRRPHLRPARPDRRRDRGAHGRDPRGVLVVRPRADADVRDEARRGSSASPRTGRRPRRSCGPSSTSPG